MTAFFTIPGKPVGYYAEGKRPNWTRRNAYVRWKRHVQTVALASGLKLPLAASREAPVFIRVTPYFQNGTHPDPENVRKGVSDALFYGSSSGDKHCGGFFPWPLYDRANPRTEVEIEWVAGTLSVNGL